MNLDICSKFWRNLEGILGNPGKISHIGWMICVVKNLMVKSACRHSALVSHPYTRGHFSISLCLYPCTRGLFCPYI